VKRVYFSETKSEKRSRKILLFVSITLLALGAIAAAVGWISSRSETLYELVDSQTANAQENAADAGVDDNNAGRPDDMARENDTVNNNADTSRNGATTDSATDKTKPDPMALSPEDADATNFQTEKMAEMQAEILTSLKALRDLQKALDDSLSVQGEKSEAERMMHLAKLIKIVNSMRPEDSARMLDKLDEDLTVNILASLTGGKASKIMANMDPEKAARLGEMMVELKPEPKLRDVMNNWQKMIEQEESANAAN
jgi:flagellar motility protein MotE (MotC chaperone)